MINSQLPFKVTAAIALIALALVCFVYGAIDAKLVVLVLGNLFHFAVGLITDTKVPEERWEKMKEERATAPKS